MVEQVTVNHPVPGSSPGGGVRSNSSAVEHLLYTEIVGGSIPSSSISITNTMKTEKIKDSLREIHIELAYLRAMIENVSNQMQELRDSIGESSNQNQSVQLPELYEHPWYKYKREQLIISGNSERSKSKEEEITLNL